MSAESKFIKKLIDEGRACYQRGEYPAAAKNYMMAAHALTGAGDALNAAEMSNNASVAHLQAGNAQAALDVVNGTPETFEAAGDLLRQGLALGNLGAALEALERFDEAADVYLQSADLLEAAGEDQMRVHVMQSLSALQLRTGRRLQALATMQAGIEGVKRPSPKQRLLKRLLDTPFRMLNPKS